MKTYNPIGIRALKNSPKEVTRSLIGDLTKADILSLIQRQKSVIAELIASNEHLENLIKEEGTSYRRHIFPTLPSSEAYFDQLSPAELEEIELNNARIRERTAKEELAKMKASLNKDPEQVEFEYLCPLRERLDKNIPPENYIRILRGDLKFLKEPILRGKKIRLHSWAPDDASNFHFDASASSYTVAE